MIYQIFAKTVFVLSLITLAVLVYIMIDLKCKEINSCKIDIQKFHQVEEIRK